LVAANGYSSKLKDAEYGVSLSRRGHATARWASWTAWLLGHSTTTITRDLYTHAVPAVHDAAAERMAALIELPAARGETEPDAKP
jgi:hypothetical protein